ncbi:hypothetical protein D3C71_2098540 [compost metagenome]
MHGVSGNIDKCTVHPGDLSGDVGNDNQVVHLVNNFGHSLIVALRESFAFLFDQEI